MNSACFRGRQVHLMGIGGAGMSALVPMLDKVGATVSGCDLGENANVLRLRSSGVRVDLGHDAEHVAGADLVVHTSAVPPQHAELRAAREAGVTVLSRAACLAELMRGSPTVAIAGSHGKTSTTWMLGHLLTSAGHDPVVMVGGNVGALGNSGTRIGDGAVCVAEVDESDGGFRHVQPTIAVVTNLEAEHLRHYGSFAALCDAFRSWLAGMGPGGVAIVPAAGLDPRVLDGVSARIVTCGFDQGRAQATEVVLGAEGATFVPVIDGQRLAPVEVPLPGRHQVLNALMALVASRCVDPDIDGATLGDCQRVGRRFTVHGRPGGVRVVEDYAHHPTEVRATVAAARLAGGRVHVLFQPHRFSRTADCFQDFATAFDGADAVVVLPVYAAGEEPIAGAGARDLAEAVAAHRATLGVPRVRTQFTAQGLVGVGFLTAHARPGDTCLVLGAGDVGALAPALVEAFAPVAVPSP